MVVVEYPLVYADWTLVNATVLCPAGIWTRLMTYTNPDPNSIIYLGGKHGYIFIDLYDDTAVTGLTMVGEYRIVACDANEIARKVVWSGDSVLAAATGAAAPTIDKTVKLKVDLRKPGIKYKSYFSLEIRALAAQTFDDAALQVTNLIYADVTRVTA